MSRVSRHMCGLHHSDGDRLESWAATRLPAGAMVVLAACSALVKLRIGCTSSGVAG